MITDIVRWGSFKRPDKQFVARLTDRAVHVVQHRRRALSVAAAVSAGVVALAALGAGYSHYAALAINEQAAAVRAEAANAALQDELGKLRNQLGAAKGQLAAVSLEDQARQQQRTDAERRLAATEATATSKGDRVSQLSHALDQVQRELHLTEAQRVTLTARLSKAETDLADQQSHKAQAQSYLDQWQKRLQQVQADRDEVAAERDALKARLSKLEEKTSMRQAAPAPEARAVEAAPAQVAVAEPPPAVVRPAPQAQAAPPVEPAPPAVAARGGRSPVGEVERVLASAGVDVAHLFSQFGVTRGEGGPFIPAPRGGVPQSTLTPEKLAALQAMMKSLPVSAPLTEYQLGSPFGVRHDPINGRSSFHTGLDLDAPYESPVYATAPGVVTYAGYRDDYGKIVEIDHGHGIATRYAHLHRYTVSVGERVAAHSQIGYLGSSGRATGPHVHYEVLVNGEPQDPAKFLELGHIVAVSQRR